jgi:type IV pilus assembly protein PilQ
MALVLGMAMAPLAGAQQAFPPPEPTYSTAPGPVPLGANPAAVELRVRRVKDAVEVVIENTGTAPQLEQSTGGGSWLGRLYTTRPSVLLRGPQAVAVPDAGFERISIEGGGTVYNLRVTPVPGYPVRPPLVSADGRNVVLSFAAPAMPSQQTMRRNSLAPGAVANPVFAPPLRQRASAPPVGDMAVGTMVLKDPSSIGELDVGGPHVTLTFKNVPALTALQALARIGGYGFITNAENSTLKTTDTRRANTAGGLREQEISTKETRVASPPVTATFVREDFRTAFNLILTGSGLQARLTPNGRTIIVGQNSCGFGGGRIASKIYRLNQASPESAAHYLASLGSFIRIPRTFQTTESIGTATNVGGGSSNGGQTSSNTTSTFTRGTEIEALGGQIGPLQGLCGTIDKRLGTITLVGQPSLVSVGEQYLKQIDLRLRQVALSIRILDVSLGNDSQIENSFAFRYGNNFILNDRGRLVGAFGKLLPPSADPANTAFNRGYPDFDLEFNPETGSGSASDLPTGYNAIGGVGRVPPLTPNPDIAIFKDVTRRNPGLSYPRDNFFDFITATIQSSTTKVLASPTLILSENSEEDDSGKLGGQAGGMSSNFLGNISTNNFVSSIGRSRNNESAVVVGEQVVTSFNVQAGQNGAPNTCQPVLGIAGLTFGAKVSKIDDNGFVTFKISPAISAGIRRELVGGCGFIDVLAIRSLDTGSARVRDGQTLILTGVISDRDIQEVTKWPILGDIPLIGQFFRNTGGNRQKRELVVMVTPRIINDTEGGTYGYGYEPTSRDARKFMTPSLSTPIPSAFPQP